VPHMCQINGKDSRPDSELLRSLHRAMNEVLSHEGGKHTAKDDWARGVFPQYAREGTLVAYTWRFVVCFTWKGGWGGREVRRFVYVGDREARVRIG
jgi:hypothetical protein